MSKWTRLPVEILTIIFNDHIESSCQLAKCRLVCRSWNLPAEVAMLGKPVDLRQIKSEDFYKYISKKPTMAKHIKDIVPDEDWGIGKDSKEAETAIKLWSIICTENLRSITGAMDNTNVLEKLCDMIEATPAKFANLRNVESCYRGEDTYIDLVRILADALEQTALDINSIELLDDCKRLKTLSITMIDESLERWEHLLQHCNNLTTLNIDFRSDQEEITKTELDTWMQHHRTQQLETLKALEFNAEYPQGFSSTICEYLLYKFPKLEDITFAAALCYVDVKDENFTRLITAIKAVKNYRLTYSILPTESLDFEVDMGKLKDGSSNKMTITWSKVEGNVAFATVKSQRSSTSVDVTVPASTTSHHFALVDIKHSAEFSALKLDMGKQNRYAGGASGLEWISQALAMLQDPSFLKETKQVDQNNKDTTQKLAQTKFVFQQAKAKHVYQNDEDTTQKLAQAMLVFQQLKTMEIWASRLTVDMTKQLPVHRELKSLEIVNAAIESNAFTTFNACFPALDYLTLSSCVFQKFLTTLTLIDDRNRGEYEDPNHRGKLFTPTLFHLELTSQEASLYLMLMPLHTMPLKIYKEQFEMCSKEPYTIIDISCGSVDTVIIRLGHISHALDVKKYMH
ncbi:hypothetical protein MBANPS3_001082 [Mucor bainieri]